MLGHRMRKSKNSCRKSVNNETDSQTRSVSTLLERKSAMNTGVLLGIPYYRGFSRQWPVGRLPREGNKL